MGAGFQRLMVVVMTFVVVLAVNLCHHQAAADPQVPCYFIFGDSLVDNGNNNNIQSLARANYLPYGIDFPGGPTGRFSNGKTTVDVIAELLGFDDYIPPYATARGQQILRGVNYASAAAGIRQETGRQLVWLQNIEDAWKPFIWRPHILPKHRFALWIFAHSKHLTKDRQPYILDKTCGVCGHVYETAQHVFFQCTASRQLWRRLWDWLEVRCTVSSMPGLLRFLRKRFRGTTMRAKRCHTGIAALIYYIWSARNRALFDAETPDVDAIFRKMLIHIHQSLATD